jgi:hypothetical protein
LHCRANPKHRHAAKRDPSAPPRGILISLHGEELVDRKPFARLLMFEFAFFSSGSAGNLYLDTALQTPIRLQSLTIANFLVRMPTM